MAPSKEARLELPSKSELMFPFYGSGVGGDKGDPLAPKVEDARMVPVKVLGYEPRLQHAAPVGVGNHLLPSHSQAMAMCLTVFFPSLLHVRLEITIVLQAVSSGGMDTLSPLTSLSP